MRLLLSTGRPKQRDWLAAFVSRACALPPCSHSSWPRARGMRFDRPAI